MWTRTADLGDLQAQGYPGPPPRTVPGEISHKGEHYGLSVIMFCMSLEKV